MRKLVLSVLALMSMIAVHADDKTTQQVTVGGQTVAKSVKTITFSGDNATLVFTDNSDMTADMESVAIHFAYGSSGITVPTKTTAGEEKVYNLKGQHVKNGTQGLSKGIYVIGGRKVVVGPTVKNDRQVKK